MPHMNHWRAGKRRLPQKRLQSSGIVDRGRTRIVVEIDIAIVGVAKELRPSL
jgi:hypothetical protein